MTIKHNKTVLIFVKDIVVLARQTGIYMNAAADG